MQTAGNTEKSINWGGVAKGAIVVAAVVAAVVVGGYAFGAAYEPVSEFISNSPFLQNLGDSLINLWNAIARESAAIWKELGKFAKELGDTITAAIAPEKGVGEFAKAVADEGTKKGLQTIGAITVGAATVPAAAAALHHTHFVTEHAAHHAAEHSAKSWAERNPSRKADGQSFAAHTPQPSASKVDAETLRAANTNLNKELGA